MSYYAIDFERPYVSPYLRRRCRSLAEVEAAHRDGAAAWKDTQSLGDGDANKRGGFGNEVMLSVPRRSDKAGLTAQGASHGGCVGSIPPAVTKPVLKPGPLHHHAQPKGGE